MVLGDLHEPLLKTSMPCEYSIWHVDRYSRAVQKK
jgi:hypothetical protein